jgi:hypothetical protein
VRLKKRSRRNKERRGIRERKIKIKMRIRESKN